jgi:hypothetical protein
MLPVQTEQPASWPNPVAQTSGTKCLQNGDFVVELVLRPHKSNRFTSHDPADRALRELPAIAWRVGYASGVDSDGELSEGAGGEVGEP